MPLRPTAFAVLIVFVSCIEIGAGESQTAIDEIKSLVTSKDLASAFDRSQTITNTNLRDKALRFVARSQFSSGDYSAAIRSAAYISDDSSRDRELRRMAESATSRDRNKFGNSGDRNLGGGAQADFDTLIELIQTTVEPETWEELGGPGTAAGFPGGVLVDTKGVLTRAALTEGDERIDSTSQVAADGETDGIEAVSVTENTDAESATTNSLRKVSLRRLEQQLQRLAALGQPASEAMKNLGGMYRVEYVSVVNAGTPNADIVLVGPGGDWTIDKEQRSVNIETGRPTLQLDDLVVLLRNTFSRDGVFGCSITPRQANLASAQQYLNKTSSKPLKPNQREAWLDGLRDHLGEQDITVHGVDPGTRVSRVIVEADYRMKLVGMGLEPSVPGVVSYLDRVTVGPDGTVAPMKVLRWWFALTKESIQANENRDVFQMPAQSVRVLSENELLTETGQRVHTGESDALNAAFARDFTEHFAELAAEYPIYAELQNVFDLALVAAVLKSEDLPARIGWQMTYFGAPTSSNWLSHRPALRDAPKTVQTVLSHRVLKRKHIVAGVSGGVRFQPETDKASPARVNNQSATQQVSIVRPTNPETWWWD